MGTLEIRKLGFALGAEVSGVDLTQPLDDEVVADIRRAYNDHILLCFPGQKLEPRAMAAICRRFGELDDNRHSPELRYADEPDVILIANKPVARVGREAAVAVRADLWHTDFSHHERPTTVTFLFAQALPAVGGDTMFANTYLAYETLTQAFRELIDPLHAVHDYSLGKLYANSSPEQRARSKALNPPVVHPLVRMHPETRRKTLYVSSKVRNIVGMTVEESRPILDFLNAHAASPEFVYRHRWSVGDFVLWDNRCSLHVAVQDYDKTQMRSMLRCSLLGPKTGKLEKEDHR